MTGMGIAPETIDDDGISLMPRRPRDPYEVPLTADQMSRFTDWLADEVQSALDARSGLLDDIRYWHRLYEQARTRIASNSPWPDAADLTSYLGTEKVDALHARIMRTIFTEPIWTVEGWGESAMARAPIVEEFHQWKAEEERLQSYLDKVTLLALIEPAGTLEVLDGTERRPVRKTIRAQVARGPDGAPMLDAEGQVVLVRNAQGRYIEVEDEDEPFAEAVVDGVETVRTGPGYAVIPYEDFVVLPVHARDRAEIWGYAKRFWRRVPELEAKARAGLYRDVDRLGTEGEREGSEALTREGKTLAVQLDRTAEKELWEVTLLHDAFTGRAERWLVATLHMGKRVLLRLQYDDLGQSRYVRFVLFPRPNSVDGFSFIGHKLLTVIEEHTAWRNMIADRAALAIAAPIKRLVGALWDPEEQPWGPKAVIDVRDHREVEPVIVPDVPSSAIERERAVVAAAERVAGINDVALGAQPMEQRTLGEIQLVAQQSFVRMDEVIRRVQEAMEDLFTVRHAIWQRTLAEQEDGVVVPSSLLVGLETRGVSTERLPGGKFTASLLQGLFRGKPRGSVETADPARQRGDYVQFLNALGLLGRVFPQVQALLQRPEAARAMLEHAVRLFKVPDRQAFLGSPTGAGPASAVPGIPGLFEGFGAAGVSGAVGPSPASPMAGPSVAPEMGPMGPM